MQIGLYINKDELSELIFNQLRGPIKPTIYDIEAMENNCKILFGELLHYVIDAVDNKER